MNAPINYTLSREHAEDLLDVAAARRVHAMTGATYEERVRWVRSVGARATECKTVRELLELVRQVEGGEV